MGVILHRRVIGRGRRVFGQRAIALPMGGGIAQPGGQMQRVAKVQADVAFLGVADGAV
ncbi:hypothetical protein D3C71_1939910 [compost metagenome]